MAFSPLDMLDMQDSEQDILRCLNRRPGLTVNEIAAAARLGLEEVEPTLRKMVESQQVVEQLLDGKRIFSVRFSRLQPRMFHIPSDVLDMLQEKPDTFLEEAPLTSLLTAQEREALLAKSVIRQLIPNEIIVWQGDRFKEIGLVRMGLVKKSRLKRGQRREALEYVRRSEWFGLSEVLSEQTSLDTYTAVTATEVITWPAEAFAEILQANSNLNLGISRLLSQLLHECQNQRVHGAGRLWVVESLEEQAGATTLAVNLALLAARHDSAHQPRVILWNAHDDGQDILNMLNLNPERSKKMMGYNILEHESGIDVLLKTEQSGYPPQVQLDILLTDLQNRYDYIICDTGPSVDHELLLRLRGQAEPLITITRQPGGEKVAAARWNQLQPFARPGQKRLLALNQLHSNGTGEADLAFHLVLPYDPEGVSLAGTNQKPVVDAAPHGPLAQALAETYRRLSLNHVIGIFVPSTLDVDQTVDNQVQIQATLSFLGGLFGGATRSDAEGVWQSNDGSLVVEQVTIVRTFVSKKALEQHLDAVINFASTLKKEMRQEAIAVDVDNQLVLV